MFKDLHFHIGRRIIKTAVSSAAAMLVTDAFDIEFPSLAIVAAVISLQPTFYETLEMSKRRVIGTIIGSALGLVCLYFSPLNLTIEVFLGVMAILAISNTFSLSNSSILGVISFVSIITMPDATYLTAINRTVNTIIGVSMSILMNFIFPVAPIIKESKILLNNICKLNIELLKESIKTITGTACLGENDFTQLNGKILANFNNAFTTKLLIEKEQRFNFDQVDIKSYSEKYSILWDVHNSVIQIKDDLAMIEDNGVVISEEINKEFQNLVNILQEAERFEAGIQKGLSKKIENSVLKIEKDYIEEFNSADFTSAYEETSFFAIIIANLKRFAENIRFFETIPVENRGKH